MQNTNKVSFLTIFTVLSGLITPWAATLSHAMPPQNAQNGQETKNTEPRPAPRQALPSGDVNVAQSETKQVVQRAPLAPNSYLQRVPDDALEKIASYLRGNEILFVAISSKG